MNRIAKIALLCLLAGGANATEINFGDLIKKAFADAQAKQQGVKKDQLGQSANNPGSVAPPSVKAPGSLVGKVVKDVYSPPGLAVDGDLMRGNFASNPPRVVHVVKKGSTLRVVAFVEENSNGWLVTADQEIANEPGMVFSGTNQPESEDPPTRCSANGKPVHDAFGFLNWGSKRRTLTVDTGDREIFWALGKDGTMSPIKNARIICKFI